MDEKSIKVLLIEDNPADARLIREILSGAKSTTIHTYCSNCISTGLKKLSEEQVDVVLLDLSLPDSQGLDTIEKVKTEVPNIPIIILTGLDDEYLAIKAVQMGAQDYLVKGQVDNNLLARSLHYAIERKKLEEKIKEVAITDDLTGLLNRRGFFKLSEQQCKLADRTKKRMALLYLDLDDMKTINDKLGHKTGDQALIDVAQILKKTFRESDIISRIGGDEFAVLLTELSDPYIENIISHLQDNLRLHNEKSGHNYNLLLSIGAVHYEPGHPCSISELLNKADKLMYEEKKQK